MHSAIYIIYSGVHGYLENVLIYKNGSRTICFRFCVRAKGTNPVFERKPKEYKNGLQALQRHFANIVTFF